MLAIVVMAAHKVECWFAREWLHSPFFAWLISLATRLGESPDDALGASIFLVFVIWLFVGLGMGLLMLRGGAGTLIALGLWGLTFLLEWHHVYRSIHVGGYYAGTISAVVYLALGPFYWVELLRHLRPRR